MSMQVTLEVSFLSHCLPTVRQLAAKWFGRVRDRDRQADLRQEAECLAWQEWTRAVERGWNMAESAGFLALTAVRRTWRGSRLAGRSTQGGCPLDHSNRQRGGVVTLSLDTRLAPHEPEDDCPVEDGRCTDPAILGAFRVDWADFVNQCSAMECHYISARLSGQTMREIAREQGVHEVTVQCRSRELRRRWFERTL